jgi:hypothetical protein
MSLFAVVRYYFFTQLHFNEMRNFINLEPILSNSNDRLNSKVIILIDLNHRSEKLTPYLILTSYASDVNVYAASFTLVCNEKTSGWV